MSTYVDPTADAAHQFLGKAIPIDRLRAAYAKVPAARAVFAAAAPGVRREATGRALETVFGEAGRARGTRRRESHRDRGAPALRHAPLAAGADTVPRYQGP